MSYEKKLQDDGTNNPKYIDFYLKEMREGEVYAKQFWLVWQFKKRALQTAAHINCRRVTEVVLLMSSCQL